VLDCSKIAIKPWRMKRKKAASMSMESLPPDRGGTPLTVRCHGGEEWSRKGFFSPKRISDHGYE
jgi:hypothetical protein